MRNVVFGLDLLGNKIPELLKVEVKHRFEPEKWNWKPFKPEKIRNIQSEIELEKESVKKALITNYVYNPAVKQKVLLSFEMGNLAFSLVNNLIERELKFVYISFTQLVLQGYISVTFNNKKVEKFLIIDDFKLSLDDISFLIWTPPRFPAPLFDFNMIPQEDEKQRHEFLFKKRWMQLLREMKYLVNSEAIWIPSDPLNGSQEWQNKIGEYLLAINLGMNVPKFIFSNNKNDIQTFLDSQHKVCLREFSTPPYSFPPIVMDNLKNIDLNNIDSSPVTFQEYINKKYEYRVVVVFDKIFPVRIYSQNSKLSEHDWRVHDDANVKWELANIPADLEKKLHKLGEKLDLKWYSVDLIETNDNEFVFLELNRPGAHYWLDLFVGLDISKEIVDYVANNKIVDKYEE